MKWILLLSDSRGDTLLLHVFTAHPSSSMSEPSAPKRAKVDAVTVESAEQAMKAAQHALAAASAQMSYAKDDDKDCKTVFWSLMCSCRGLEKHEYNLLADAVVPVPGTRPVMGAAEARCGNLLGDKCTRTVQALMTPETHRFEKCSCTSCTCDHLWLRVNIYCATCDGLAPANLMEASMRAVYDFKRVKEENRFGEMVDCIEVTLPLMTTELVCERCTRHVKGLCDPDVCRLKHDEDGAPIYGE